MNTRRGWLILIGLTVIFLLGGGAYFLSAIHVPNNPPVAAQPPVTNPPSEAKSSAPPTAPADSPQSQGSSGPAPVYLYNARGQLQVITYSDGSTYTYAYDAYGDKIRETNGTKTWTYVYDQNHHPLSVIDPQGHITHKEVSPTTPNAN